MSSQLVSLQSPPALTSDVVRAMEASTQCDSSDSILDPLAPEFEPQQEHVPLFTTSTVAAYVCQLNDFCDEACLNFLPLPHFVHSVAPVKGQPQVAASEIVVPQT